MRISDWSSDVCSSDLIEARAFGLEVHRLPARHPRRPGRARQREHQFGANERTGMRLGIGEDLERQRVEAVAGQNRGRLAEGLVDGGLAVENGRATSELQSLMRTSYAVCCMKKKMTI